MAQNRVYLLLAIALILSACQKQPEHESPSQDINHEVSTTAVNHSLCDTIQDSLQSITNRSTIEAVEQVNLRIKQCLPQLNMGDRTSLLYSSTAMYQRFLSVDRTPKQQLAFEQYALDDNSYPTLQHNHSADFSERDQYLIKNQGQGYYEIYDNMGHAMYRRQPRYLNDMFAPYLPEAEEIFISHLAQQNQQPVMSRNTFNLTWSEIADRAQFWEQYAQKFPHSAFVEDAQRLKFAYIHFLFHGLPNMPVSTSYEGEDSIHPEALMEIKMLTQQPHSQLAKKAEKFLKFIDIPDTQRDQNIPIELSPIEQRSSQKDIIIENRQLDQYMGLNDPLSLDSTHINRDCFSDAICITHVGNVANKLPSKQQF